MAKTSNPKQKCVIHIKRPETFELALCGKARGLGHFTVGAIEYTDCPKCQEMWNTPELKKPIDD